MSKSLLGTLVILGVCIFLSSCATAPTEVHKGKNISSGLDTSSYLYPFLNL